MRPIVFTAIVLWLTAASGAAWATEKDEAKKHFEAGNKLRQLEDYTSAAAEYELSVRLFPTKNALFNLANCYKAMHRYDKSLATYERLLAEFAAQMDEQMREATEKDISDLRSLVGELTLQVDVNGAAVSVDGRAVGSSPIGEPLILSPGEHQIEVVLSGEPAQLRRVTIMAGEKKTESFTLQAAPPPPVSPPEPIAPVEGPPAPGPVKTEPAPVVSQQVAPAAERSGKPSVLFWIGLPATVVVGAASAVFWVFGSKRKSDFENKKEAYEKLGSSAQTMALWEEIDDAAGDAELYNKIAIGTTIGAGVLAVGSTLVLIFDLRRDEAPGTVAFKAAPDGFALSF